MNLDPAIGGYVYLCVQKPTGGWSCANTRDTPAIATLPASQQTYESDTLIDFTVVQNDLSALKAKTC